MEVREPWRPSNASSASNLPPGICTHGGEYAVKSKMYWCTIVHEPLVLAHNDRLKPGPPKRQSRFRKELRSSGTEVNLHEQRPPVENTG
ncbi:hypothetical protein TNCV_3272381 [Trichonephila clavipes]|nr:hypothetical protein TNCV_3272381 [Trichonephila clavipes]